jgi:hypothetical protein
MTEDGAFAGYGPGYSAYLVDWLPVVTVAPSLPSYTCHGNELLDADPNTKVVYSGAKRTAPGTASIDVPDAAILAGVYGQRACLSEVATVSAQQALCIVQAPILGQDPHACPFVNKIVTRSVAGKTMALAPASTPPALKDTTAPSLAVTGGGAQRVIHLRGVRVVVSCPAEACAATAKGKVLVRRSAKVYKLLPATKQIAKAGKATLKLKLKRRALAAIGRALKARKRVSAKITLTARDAAGNVTTKRRVIRLRR